MATCGCRMGCRGTLCLGLWARGAACPPRRCGRSVFSAPAASPRTCHFCAYGAFRQQRHGAPQSWWTCSLWPAWTPRAGSAVHTRTDCCCPCVWDFWAAAGEAQPPPPCPPTAVPIRGYKGGFTGLRSRIDSELCDTPMAACSSSSPESSLVMSGSEFTRTIDRSLRRRVRQLATTMTALRTGSMISSTKFSDGATSPSTMTLSAQLVRAETLLKAASSALFNSSSWPQLRLLQWAWNYFIFTGYKIAHCFCLQKKEGISSNFSDERIVGLC